jgi:hypothetical protein
MRYILDCESTVMNELLAAADTRVALRNIRHLDAQRNYGRGHEVTIEAGRALARAKMGRTQLKLAAEAAEPERATGTFEGSLQVGDEMPFVYGAPRNDPRSPRVKRSNARRRSA